VKDNMKLKIFIKKDCPKCPAAKQFGEEVKDKVKVIYFSIDEVNGVAEARYYDILGVPSLVLTKREKEIKTWRNEVPTLENFTKYI